MPEESKAPLIKVVIEARYLGDKFATVKLLIKSESPEKQHNENDKYKTHERSGVAIAVITDPAENKQTSTVRQIQLPYLSEARP